MTPLDTLTLLRPKAEAGRAPTGDEAGPRAAPGFEAMLEAFEARPAEADAEGDEAAPLPIPADLRSGEAGTDASGASGASLRDLMALATPVPAAPAPALPPEAALSAIVQRAAARAGTPAAEAPSPAPRMSLIGIETHFAPVQPRAVPGAEATRNAGFAVPDQAQGPAPTATAPAFPTETPTAALRLDPHAVPSQAAMPGPVGNADKAARGGVQAPAASLAQTAASSSAILPASPDAEHPAAPQAVPVTASAAPAARQASPEASARLQAGVSTAPRPAEVPSSEIRPIPSEASGGRGADVPARAPVAPSAPPPALTPPLAPAAAEAHPATVASDPAVKARSTDAATPPATAPTTGEALPAAATSEPAVTAQFALPAVDGADTAPPSAMKAAPIADLPPASEERIATAAAPASAPIAAGPETAPPRQAGPTPPAHPTATAEAAALTQPQNADPSDAPRLAAAASAVASGVISPAPRGETQRPLEEPATAQAVSVDGTPPPVPGADRAAAAPVPNGAPHRAAGERQAAAQTSRPGSPAPAAREAGPDPLAVGSAPDPALPPSAEAEPAVVSPRTLAGDAPGGTKDDLRAPAGAMPAVPPYRSEAGVAPPRAEQTASLPPARMETAIVSERRPEESPGTAGLPVEPRAPETPAPMAPVTVAPTGHPVPASPLRQIVDAVSAQFPAAPPSAPARTTVPAEAGPLRILTLQLHPADLGTVLVRMRLQDGRLEMNLRTGREDTAERLRREGGALSELLREAGYAPQSLTIEAGGGLGTASERGAPQNFSAGLQNGQSGGASADQPPGRRPSREGQEPAPRAKEQDHDSASSARDRDHGDRYL